MNLKLARILHIYQSIDYFRSLLLKDRPHPFVCLVLLICCKEYRGLIFHCLRNVHRVAKI